MVIRWHLGSLLDLPRNANIIYFRNNALICPTFHIAKSPKNIFSWCLWLDSIYPFEIEGQILYAITDLTENNFLDINTLNYIHLSAACYIGDHIKNFNKYESYLKALKDGYYYYKKEIDKMVNYNTEQGKVIAALKNFPDGLTLPQLEKETGIHSYTTLLIVAQKLKRFGYVTENWPDDGADGYRTAIYKLKD